MKPQFLTKLLFEDDGGFPFTLTGPLSYYSAILGTIVVETGFKTDLASIPKILWNVLPPVGSYDAAAVVHDWLYRTGGVAKGRPNCTRSEADRVLLEAMEALGAGPWARRTIYAGVRVGGWVTWRKYRGGQ